MSFIPQSSYSKNELIDCSKGKLFTKSGDGRLPSDNMLMFDKIVKIDDCGGEFNKGSVIANLNINPDLWFFDCHFKEDPVMPGCLGLDAMWQLLGFYLLWSGLPGIDTYWTYNRRIMDIYWACNGHAIEMQWTSNGHMIDMHWSCNGSMIYMSWSQNGHVTDR